MLKIVGDINLTDGYFDVGFGIGSKLAKGFDPFTYLERKEEDLWIGNFEGVASNGSDKAGMAKNQFRIAPKNLTHLKHMDVYGVANNHAMQHGNGAYEETVSTLEKLGARCFGMDERRSIVIEHQKRVISLTGFSQRIDSFSEKPLYWHNPELWDIECEVKKLPKEAFKIAYVHWGNEFINYPSSTQKKWAHWIVDCVYDLVIGMHPHIMQGHEVYSGRHIFYSIGNFVFDMPWEPTKYGAVINIDFSGPEAKISCEYARIGKDFAPRIIPSGEVPSAYRFEHLNTLIGREENSEEYHHEIDRYYRMYRSANHRDIIYKMIKHPESSFSLITDFIKRHI
jgi:hypothetical protein